MQIIHGENQIASRAAFIALKKNGQNLNGDSVTLSDVISAISSPSLFGESTTLFIEGLFSARPSGRKTEIIDYLAAHNDLAIVIWEHKDVSVQLKSFDPKTSQRFDLPKMIFSFMDRPTIELLHKCLESMPVEQVFASLVTRLYKQEKSADLQKLLELDYKNKTSQLPYDMVCALEIFILGTQ